METQIAELAALIRQLRAGDKRFRVFGSSSHRYKLNRALSETQLRDFEEAHDVAVPDDYRAFLREIGNGGAGPSYGLHCLEASVQECDVREPFPFVEATDFSDTEIDRFYADGALYPGMIRFCHHGCAIYSELIVNGPAYGTIWGDEGYGDFYPTGKSFFAWYRDWASRSVEVLANEKLAGRIRKGMTKAEVLEAIPVQWSERESLIEPKSILSAPDIPFNVELNPAEIVIQIKPWPFI